MFLGGGSMICNAMAAPGSLLLYDCHVEKNSLNTGGAGFWQYLGLSGMSLRPLGRRRKIRSLA